MRAANSVDDFKGSCVEVDRGRFGDCIPHSCARQRGRWRRLVLKRIERLFTSVEFGLWVVSLPMPVCLAAPSLQVLLFFGPPLIPPSLGFQPPHLRTAPSLKPPSRPSSHLVDWLAFFLVILILPADTITIISSPPPQSPSPSLHPPLDMPSQAPPKSPSPFLNSVEEDGPISPHNPPISSPISQIDAQLYDSLSAFEDELLAVAASDNDCLIRFNQRWIVLQSQVQQARDDGQLGEETVELYDSVTVLITSLCNALLEGESRREEVASQLLEKLSNMFDSELALLIPKPPKSKHSSPKHKKPSLQHKRTPTELSKTHRKRRAEAGIPGQESLKFRPCRDFFMEHLSDPYPNSSQKQELMRAAGISPASLNQWFTNTRRRSNWMDIMKDHANGRKEDMKLLVERALAAPEPGLPPVSEEARDAINKMRQYVDELAREVVSQDFLSVLEELRPMSEAQALQYQDQLRTERKKKQLMKKESMQTLDEDAEDGDSDDDYQPVTGEKRKRTAGPSDSAPLKRAREGTSSSSLDIPRQRPKRSRDDTPSFAEAPGYSDQSPPKRPRISTDIDEEPPHPPTDLSRRRTTTLERHQPLSTTSTLVEGFNVAQFDTSPPSPLPTPMNQEITFSFDDYQDLEWPNGVSTIDVAATADDLIKSARSNVSIPYHFKFDSSAYTDGSINARSAAVAEWAKTLVDAASPEYSTTPPFSALLASPTTTLSSPPPRPTTNDDFWNDLARSAELAAMLASSSPEMNQSQNFRFDMPSQPVANMVNSPIYQQNTGSTFQDQQQPFSPSFFDSSPMSMVTPSTAVDYHTPVPQSAYFAAPSSYQNQKVEHMVDVHLQPRWDHDGHEMEYPATSTMQESFIPTFYAAAS